MTANMAAVSAGNIVLSLGLEGLARRRSHLHSWVMNKQIVIQGKREKLLWL
jgi:hypothetical protein